MYGAEATYKRLVGGHKVWTFGLDATEVPDFLAAYGWQVREHVGAEEYRRDYFVPVGRTMPIMEIERAVVAEKQ
jgi:O-methyltransferase involved in polyketide biosynthesis